MTWDSPTALLPLLKQLNTVLLSSHVIDGTTSLVNNKIPSDTTKNGYLANNYSTSVPAATRNNNLFCNTLDLTAISVINDGSLIDSSEVIIGAVDPLVAGFGHPGMLISPRHIIGANHWHGKGPWVFKDKLGVYKSVSLVHGQAVTGTDIWIGYLDTAVTTISPLKILPASWRNYFPVAFTVPVLSKTVHSISTSADQWNINQCHSLDTLGGYWSAYTLAGSDPATSPWFTPISGGDSGGPVLMLINNSLALIGAYYSPTGGPHYGNYISSINAAMNNLAFNNGDDTYYSVGTVDLSKFTYYP